MIMYKCDACGACYEHVGQCDCHADVSYTKTVVLSESDALIVEHALRVARTVLYHSDKWHDQYGPWVACSNALDVFSNNKKD